MPVFTGTTPKPKRKEKGGKRGEKKKGFLALIMFVLPTLESDKKALATHRFRHLERGVPFSKIQVDMYECICSYPILDTLEHATQENPPASTIFVTSSLKKLARIFC